MTNLSEQGRELLEKATNRPWRSKNAGKAIYINTPDPGVGSRGVARMDWTVGPPEAQANADITVFAVNHLSKLLTAYDEREAAKAESDRLRKALSELVLEFSADGETFTEADHRDALSAHGSCIAVALDRANAALSGGEQP